MYARHSCIGLPNVIFMSSGEYDVAKVRLLTLRQWRRSPVEPRDIRPRHQTGSLWLASRIWL